MGFEVVIDGNWLKNEKRKKKPKTCEEETASEIGNRFMEFKMRKPHDERAIEIELKRNSKNEITKNQTHPIP